MFGFVCVGGARLVLHTIETALADGRDEGLKTGKEIHVAAMALARSALLLLVACVVSLIIFSLVSPIKAYANPDLVSSNVTSTMEISGTISLQFSNNIVGYKDMATGAWRVLVFDDNVACISLIDENGSPASFSAYHTFGGDQGNDPYFSRQVIYLDYGPLQPGTAYTLSIAPGMCSAGNAQGHTGQGSSLYFTTTGEKPQSNQEKPSEQTSEPTPTPSDGGGGSGGQGGSSTIGGGLDQNGAQGTSASSGTSPEAQAEASIGDAAVEASPKSGESRAAGEGGGVVYAIGQGGLDRGDVGGEEPIEAPSSPWQFAAALCLAAVGLALLGATKRAMRWRRQRAHGASGS